MDISEFLRIRLSEPLEIKRTRVRPRSLSAATLPLAAVALSRHVFADAPQLKVIDGFFYYMQMK